MRVAVVGLGSIGLGLACSALRAGHEVHGMDMSAARREAFAAEGGTVHDAVADTVRDADAIACVVVNAAQTEDVLFGSGAAAAAAPSGAVFLSCATVAPGEAQRLGQKAADAGLLYIDAPTSGGPAKAMSGDMTLMASGSEAAFERAAPLLDAIAGRVYRLGDAPGAGSAMKIVNQLLAGVHIATACEAMAFATRLGLDARQVYEVITNAAGSSWMFENRVPHILDGDYSPKSAVNIFTKDLGIVLDTARANEFPVPMASMGLQMFEMTAAAGMGGDDDASVARLYARLAGLSLPGQEEPGGG